MSDVVAALDRLTAAVRDEPDAWRDEDYLRIGARHEPLRLNEPGMLMKILLTPAMHGGVSTPELPELFRKAVPPDYYEYRGELVVIVCVCRRGPILVQLGSVGPCTCGRWFLATETAVHVAKLSPVSKPVPTTQTASASGAHRGQDGPLRSSHGGVESASSPTNESEPSDAA